VVTTEGFQIRTTQSGGWGAGQGGKSLGRQRLANKKFWTLQTMRKWTFIVGKGARFQHTPGTSGVCRGELYGVGPHRKGKHPRGKGGMWLRKRNLKAKLFTLRGENLLRLS